MEVEQMMTFLLAEIKTNQEEMMARLEATIRNQEKMDTNLKEIKASQ
jgi:hypothetical protein